MPSLAVLGRDVGAFHQSLIHSIFAVRNNARLAGARDLGDVLGSTVLPGHQQAAQDIARAQRYADGIVYDVGRDAVTIKQLDARLTTAAVTENARAFNEQRRAAVQQLDDAYSLVEIWDARMDACPACWELNGTESIGGLGFPSGEEPGGAHPNCRCTSHFERRIFH